MPVYALVNGEQKNAIPGIFLEQEARTTKLRAEKNHGDETKVSVVLCGSSEGKRMEEPSEGKSELRIDFRFKYGHRKCGGG